MDGCGSGAYARYGVHFDLLFVFHVEVEEALVVVEALVVGEGRVFAEYLAELARLDALEYAAGGRSVEAVYAAMDGELIVAHAARRQVLEIVVRAELAHRRLRVHLEQERRAHHADRAERHGGRGHPRLEAQAERQEDARRHRYADQIVEGGEEEVEADAAHRLLGQVDGGYDVQQVVANEHNVSGLDRNVRAGADGDADVGLGERRRVVDPIADHGDLLAGARLQVFDFAHLLRGQHFGEHVADADLFGDVGGRFLVVAREQDDLEAHLLERVDGQVRLVFDLVGDDDHGDDEAVDGAQHARVALQLVLLHSLVYLVVHGEEVATHPLAVANQHVHVLEAVAHLAALAPLPLVARLHSARSEPVADVFELRN